MNIENYQDRLLKTATELMQIPSVKEPSAGEGKPFGTPIAQALEYMLEKGRELGFEARNYSGYAGHIQFGQGDETLGILCHLDVVPAGDGWSVDPYKGKIKDGKLYGRGTIDNKGPAVAVLYAMAALRDSGWQPQRTIRLILGTDEESGWGCMDHYMKVAGKPDVGFAPDADFPVINSEKGILMIELTGSLPAGSGIALADIRGGNRPNMVPDRCQLRLRGLSGKDQVIKIAAEIGARVDAQGDDGELSLVFKGVSAHGSTPELGDNAISYALAVIDRMGLKGGLTGFLQQHVGFDCDGRKLNLELKDKVSGPLTLNLGVISLEGETVKVQLDIRYPVSFKEETILERINQVLPPDFTLTRLGGMGPLHVDANSELIQTLQKVYEKHTGQEAKLISIGGGTYARAMDNAVAFGPVFPGQPELAHQQDEFIEVSHLYKLTEIYADAIALLGSKGGT